MLKTRRQLDAENKALRARLGAAAGETRKMLNQRVKDAEHECKELRESLRIALGWRAEGVSNTSEPGKGDKAVSSPQRTEAA